VEWRVYCENFVMFGLTADAGDNLKNRTPIPLAPCIYETSNTSLRSKSLNIPSPTSTRTTLIKLKILKNAYPVGRVPLRFLQVTVPALDLKKVSLSVANLVGFAS
jgi:hypothetical protein